MPRRGSAQRPGWCLALDGTVQTLVEIGSNFCDQRINAIFEEVVGAFNHRVLDLDAFLRLQLFDQAHHLAQGRNPVLVAMDEQTR